MPMSTLVHDCPPFHHVAIIWVAVSVVPANSNATMLGGVNGRMMKNQITVAPRARKKFLVCEDIVMKIRKLNLIHPYPLHSSSIGRFCAGITVFKHHAFFWINTKFLCCFQERIGVWFSVRGFTSAHQRVNQIGRPSTAKVLETVVRDPPETTPIFFIPTFFFKCSYTKTTGNVLSMCLLINTADFSAAKESGSSTL